MQQPLDVTVTMTCECKFVAQVIGVVKGSYGSRQVDRLSCRGVVDLCTPGCLDQYELTNSREDKLSIVFDIELSRKKVCM